MGIILSHLVCSQWRIAGDSFFYNQIGKTETASERALGISLSVWPIDKKTWKYVDDMQTHVWEMRYLPKEIRERFHSDMRIVLDYLAEGNAYRSDRKVIHKEATIKMLRVLSGDKNVDDTEEILKGLDIAEEDEISMCELFDQYTRRGISQGISKGIIIMCKDFNATYEDTLHKLKNKLNISEKEAEEQMKLYW